MPASSQTRESVAARRARVVELRRSGLGFEAIYHVVPGLKNAKHATTDLRRALSAEAELLTLTDAFSPALESSRLDFLQTRLEMLLQNAMGGGEARLADPAMAVRIIGRLLEVSRCRLALQGIEVEPADGPDVHLAHDGADDDRDGLHSHSHVHQGDTSHSHVHHPGLGDMIGQVATPDPAQGEVSRRSGRGPGGHLTWPSRSAQRFPECYYVGMTRPSGR